MHEIVKLIKIVGKLTIKYKKDKLLALPANIRLAGKGFPVTNAPAYLLGASVTMSQIFVILTHGQNIMKLFCL
jgi:hypothetical protein